MNLKLDRTRAAVLVIDVQSRLAPTMPPEALARVVKYGRALVGGKGGDHGRARHLGDERGETR